MECPACHHGDTQVLDSRDGPACVRRRRECLACKQRFTTYERVETPSLVVLKKNGDRQHFDPEKIRRGVQVACKSRPVTTAQIDDLVRGAEQQVAALKREEIASSEIGAIVKELLQEIDPVACLRFTSVYQAFADLRQFEQEIHNLPSTP